MHSGNTDCEKKTLPVRIGVCLKAVVLGLAVALALIAGWTDWRSRRIPNWLTVPGLLIGVRGERDRKWFGRAQGFPAGRRLGSAAAFAIRFSPQPRRRRLEISWSLGSFRRAWQVLVDLLMGSVFVAGVMALGSGDLQRTIEGNAAQHRQAAVVDVYVSDAWARSFAG